ncbi:type I-E CRISPR-associated protein Cas7/Cse4/CasC [Streptomyces sp. AJS327]|uniref:type I-E CRISPR-associated protein Cas7/Cse4/CasC n=1 Tax=Streptomyces sp. AJS327 TaxID=2545265 RepID=UPI0015DDD065|nr:type I-E CRISPR-associated protein Cas7/Cse4/CasC [Streptomyces sp. AJS327]MBA0050163.1 type I-E CRISPR-associated protein Cas7/Cse4/CasC [Streptomyces sp. AJS327]
MTRTILDIHVLQTVPPSNLNRDDTGMPKTAVYGGVRRARVSSQAWKRATRLGFNETLPPSELGVRTRKVAELLGERITERAPALRPVAVELAAETLRTATGTKIEVPPRRQKKDVEEGAQEPAPESSYLLFLSALQLDALAALATEGAGTEGAGAESVEALKKFLKTKENRSRVKEAVDTRHSVDIALFGRMVADSADLTVDAAVQVAHALGVHGSEIESDYFTAVDDRSKAAEESGAGMIGTVDFNSATLYRYAALDVNQLRQNLGGLKNKGAEEPTQRAVVAFLENFLLSLPNGKSNSFAHQTVPAAAVVKLRSRRPVSFVGAFEEPVPRGENGGYMQNSCERLAKHASDLEHQLGLADAEHSWVLRFGDETSALSALGTQLPLDELLTAVGSTMTERLAAGTNTAVEQTR